MWFTLASGGTWQSRKPDILVSTAPGPPCVARVDVRRLESIFELCHEKRRGQRVREARGERKSELRKGDGSAKWQALTGRERKKREKKKKIRKG